MEVKFKRIHSDAVLPKYTHPGEDAGLDLICTEKYETRDYIGYKIGWAVEVPIGYYGDLRPRSSNCNKDLLLCNSCGTVDSGYRGEIELRYKRITNQLDKLNNIQYQIGDKVGQLIIKPYPMIEPLEVEELSPSLRGECGYGSSGN